MRRYRWQNAEMGGMVAHTQKWGDPLAAEGRTIPPPFSVFLAPSLSVIKFLFQFATNI